MKSQRVTIYIAEYVHWIRGKRAVSVVKRWHDVKNDEERDRYDAAHYRE